MEKILKLICYDCNEEKILDEFPKNKRNKYGHSNRCKDCTKIYKANYFQNNLDKIKIYRAKYNLDNVERDKEYHKNYRLKNNERKRKNDKAYRENNKTAARKYNINYREINKETLKINAQRYKKKRMKEDPVFNLITKLRTLNYCVMRSKNFSKSKSFKEYLGCTPKELKIHFEKQFKKGMGWEKVFNGLIHIDHIVPISLAKTEEEVYKLNHYTNLQPLWARDNLRKSNKFKSIENHIYTNEVVSQ